MSISQVRPFVGKRCTIRFTDKSGNEIENVVRIEATRFEPYYGSYLITDRDEVRLDKVTGIEPLE